MHLIFNFGTFDVRSAGSGLLLIDKKLSAVSSTMGRGVSNLVSSKVFFQGILVEPVPARSYVRTLFSTLEARRATNFANFSSDHFTGGPRYSANSLIHIGKNDPDSLPVKNGLFI